MKYKVLTLTSDVSEVAKLQAVNMNSQAEATVGTPENLTLQPCGARWYALYTCAHHEKSVARQIEERKLPCFLPLYRSVRRWKDRRKELELALFPSYLFVQLERKNWVQVLQLPSVVSLVSIKGQPVPIPDGDIEALKRGLAGQLQVRPHPYLRTGKRVRVRSGPFMGMDGIVRRVKDRFRLVLSVELLQRSLSVELDGFDVEAAN